jgi:hypothetical protein
MAHISLLEAKSEVKYPLTLDETNRYSGNTGGSTLTSLDLDLQLYESTRNMTQIASIH